MRRFIPAIRKALVLSLLGTLPALGSSPATQLPLDPAKNSGQSVTAAYEGWLRNEDGTYSLLVGYFNRNLEETLDIPIGPNNHIEPGGPDQGQPTHFLPRRQWGVFTIKVPADFAGKKLTWTLVANNQTTQIPMGLNPLWEVEPLRDAAQGNTPPVVRFAPDGKPFQGPPSGIAASLETTLSEPVALTVWGMDDGVVNAYSRERDGPPLHLIWSKYRGPGDVSFDKAEPEIDESEGKATTTASFREAGSYILRLQANDVSGDGGGGAQCCWTNVHVQVTVVDR